MSQSQLRHLGDNFLYWSWFTLHFCVMRWGLSGSECVRVCGCELCTAFQHSVSVRPGVMLPRCRQECTDCACVGCGATFYTQRCQFLLMKRFDFLRLNVYELRFSLKLHIDRWHPHILLLLSLQWSSELILFFLSCFLLNMHCGIIGHCAILDSAIPASHLELMQTAGGYFFFFFSMFQI